MKYLYFFFVLIIIGCSNNNREPVHEVYLNKHVLDSAKSLSIVKVYNNSAIKEAESVYIYADSLLILRNPTTTFLPMVSVLNMKCQPVKNLFYYGNGQGELLSADISIRDEKLFVNDYIKSQIAIISLDSLLLRHSYKTSLKKYNIEGITAITPSSDGSLIFANPFYFQDSNNGISQGDSRLIKTSEDNSYSVYGNYKYGTWNIEGNGFLVSNNSKRFIYASGSTSQLECYDEKLHLTKIIKGPISIEPTYYYSEPNKNGIIQVAFSKKIPYTYVDCCSDSSYVYFLYIGDFLYDGHDASSFKSYILQYNWNCDLVETYSYNGFLQTLSKGKAKGVFYSLTENKDGNMMLLKLKAL